MTKSFAAARRWLGLAALVVWAAVSAAAYGQADEPPQQRKTFPNSVRPIASQPGVQFAPAKAAVDDKQRMTIQFSLSRPKEVDEKLQKLVLEGKVLTPAQYAAEFSVPKAVTDGLKTWLTEQGYKIVDQSSDGTSVYASAPVSAIESSLKVRMRPVVAGGVNFSATEDVPSLPADVGAHVSGIIGLQPYRHAIAK